MPKFTQLADWQSGTLILNLLVAHALSNESFSQCPCTSSLNHAPKSFTLSWVQNKRKKKMRKGRKRERKEEGGREKERGEGGDGGTEKDSASQPLDTTPTSQPSLFLCCRNLGFPSLYFRDVKVYFFEKL